MLQSGVESLKGIGSVRAAQLSRLGVCTVEDLLFYLPRTYRDYSVALPVAVLRHGMDCAVRVRLLSEPTCAYFHGLTLVSAEATDGTGKLRLKWYNQPYRRGQLHVGDTAVACGRIDARKGLSMLNPSLSTALPGLLPVYPLAQGLTQRALREAVERALPAVHELHDPFPQALLDRYALCPLQQALLDAHHPASREALSGARRRLAFQDVLYYLLNVELQKQERRRHTGISFDCRGVRERYLQKLPFAPTGAQLRVMEEIAGDMAAPSPMNRLLQGDVGSGKTAVALYALCVACANGYQGVLMAPTEILAGQHYETLRAIFGDAVCLLRGGLPRKRRAELLRQIASGRALAVVGTHALLQEDVRFQRLGLVVTDEQHRFGVAQRAAIADKGVRPDVLVMSATPIPRTLALLLYGDLDVSILDELPPGRKPVRTSFIPEHRREDMYAYLARQAAQGVQSYVVCPFIDATETTNGRSAEELYAELQKRLPGARIGLLHGRMRPAEKEAAIEAFRRGEVGILVTTTVIEVGVHVPNASIMVVEGADRFGLAQLHQLRGRVGRSDAQAYCFLLSDSGSETALERLSVMTTTHDGFVIAEHDLAQRGPGDFFGTRQHGESGVSLDVDTALLQQAAEAARDVLERPTAGNEQLLQAAQERYTARFSHIVMN